MKHALIALTVALGCSPALAEDFKPFGVPLNVPLSSLDVIEHDSDDLYRINVPLPNELFDTYLAEVRGDMVCGIEGVHSAGVESAMRTFDAAYDRLSQIYSMSEVSASWRPGQFDSTLSKVEGLVAGKVIYFSFAESGFSAPVADVVLGMLRVGDQINVYAAYRSEPCLEFEIEDEPSDLQGL